MPGYLTTLNIAITSFHTIDPYTLLTATDTHLLFFSHVLLRFTKGEYDSFIKSIWSYCAHYTLEGAKYLGQKHFQGG